MGRRGFLPAFLIGIGWVRRKVRETVAIVYRFRNEFSITDPQRFLHAIAQRFASEGFGQEVISARSESMSAGDFSTHRGDEHDGNSRRGRVTPEDLAHGKAIEIRQPQVEQDKIGGMTPDEGQAVRSGFRG